MRSGKRDDFFFFFLPSRRLYEKADLHCACKCYALLKVLKKKQQQRHICHCLLPGHCVVRRHAHTEAERGRPPVWEGDVWWHHGLRSEQSKGDRFRTAVHRGAEQKPLRRVSVFCWSALCCHFFFFFWTETAGDSDRDVGLSAQRDPLLLHAPRLGRHTR